MISAKPLSSILLALVLATSACGSSDDASIVAADGNQAEGQQSSDQGDRDLPIEDQPNTDEDATSGSEPTADPASGDDATQSPDTLPADSGSSDLIGSANIGGEIVDPQPHEIADLLIAESYPEQLSITFVAGDENCLAATATATISEDGTQVTLSLETGITTDAMSKSCMAGDFEHHLTIHLEEGLDGRDVVMPGFVQDEETLDGDASPAATTAPVAPSILEAIIGMSEDEASSAAASDGFDLRPLMRDGESLLGTSDYRTSRINVAVDDGIVTKAWIG